MRLSARLSGIVALALSVGCAGAGNLSLHETTRIEAGREVYRCAWFAVPRDNGPLWVNRAQSHFTGSAHHFVVYRTALEAVPDGGGQLRDCDERAWASGITGYYYEAQTPDAERTLPPGIAHRFAPGEVLLLQVHYVNATTQSFDSSVSFNMNRLHPAEATTEAGTLFFSNPQIDLPPRSVAAATVRCPLHSDVHLALVWSHMHARGTSFVAELDGAALYESDSWAEPVPRDLTDPPTLARAGATVSFTCRYDNSGDATFTSGPSAVRDEMCVLHGLYWPRADAELELCDRGVTDGGGAAAAGPTWDCLHSCGLVPSSACLGGCWQAARPDVAMPVGALERCQAAECADSCALGGGAACRSCQAARCARESALFAAAD